MKHSHSTNIFRLAAKRLTPLVRMPAFWVVTFLGNSFVGFGAVMLKFLEGDLHARTLSTLDCISWSVGLVTTIGYSDVIPMTDPGKVLGIVMMIGGTLFLWSYMALLVGVLLAPDIRLIEQDIKGIKKETFVDDKKLDELKLAVDQFQKTVDQLMKSNRS